MKVTQEASWVGLGWDLLTDASVTQIVKDEDDIFAYNSTRYQNLYPDWMSNGATYYTALDYLDCWDEVSGDYVNNFYRKRDVYNPMKDFGYAVSTRGFIPINGVYARKDQNLGASGLDDSEPDVFKINIRGESLSVIFDRTRVNNPNPTIIVLNKKGYKVTYINNSEQWEIIDPDGHKYYFQTKSDVKNLTSGRTYNIQSRVWFLNKIITRNGHEIQLYYANAGSFNKFFKPNTKAIPISMTSDYITIGGPGASGYVGSHPGFNNNLLNYDSEINETQYYLQAIEFPKGRIAFILSGRTDIAGKRKLDKMTIYNKNDQKIKEVAFSYGYYLGEDMSAKKLKLNTILINNELYRFQYNTESLPSINSFAVDFWGYYNGESSNKSLAPNPVRWKSKSPYSSFFAEITETSYPNVTTNNNSARLQYTKAGILENIQYPTGGKVAFEYELNEFSNYWVPDYDSLTNVVSKGDGLRIKNILFTDSDNKIIKKENYSYSGGKEIRPLQFFQIIEYNFTESPQITVNGDIGRLGVTRVKILQCSTSGNYADNPLSSFSGVGYDKVTKKTIGDDNNSNGRIEIYYNNTPDVVGALSISTTGGSPQNYLPAFKNSDKPANGTLQKKIYYNEQEIKVLQEKFEYTNKESRLFYGVNVGGYSQLLFRCWHSGSDRTVDIYERFLLGYYPVFDFESLLTKKTAIQYAGNDSIEYPETYTYNTDNLLSIKTQSDSQSRRHLYFKYPQDYKTDPYTQMVTNNILSPVIENTTLNQNGNTIEIHKFNYTDAQTKTNGLILPESEEISYSYGAGTRTIATYDKYDVKGNLLQYTGLDGTKVTYLWGYNHQYPIARIENASYSDVCNKIGNNNETAGKTTLDNIAIKLEPSASDSTTINNLRSQLTDAMVTTFTYNPLVGVRTAIDPHGVKVTYHYDTFGRLQAIKDENNKVLEDYEYHYKP